MKNWKRRYFRLNAIRLAYFESSEEVSFHFLPADPLHETVFSRFSTVFFDSHEGRNMFLFVKWDKTLHQKKYERLCK